MKTVYVARDGLVVEKPPKIAAVVIPVQWEAALNSRREMLSGLSSQEWRQMHLGEWLGPTAPLADIPCSDIPKPSPEGVCPRYSSPFPKF